MAFWFAVWGNMQCIFVVMAMISGVTGFLLWLWVNCVGEYADPKPAHWKKRIIQIASATIVCGALACIPSVDDLWRARVAARGLECKYLDSCGGKKP